MAACPKATPINFGVRDGVVDPAGIRTFAGVTVTVEVSLLVKVTYRLEGAGAGKLTG